MALPNEHQLKFNAYKSTKSLMEAIEKRFGDSYPDLEKAKTAQAKEIASLKKRVKQLEKRKKLRTSGLKRLRKIGSASRVESSNDIILGVQEDASKRGRKIADLDAEELTLIDETQERIDEDLMFDIDVLNGDEVFEEPIVNVAKTTSSILVSVADPVTATREVVTTASTTTTVDELTLAQTLIENKAARLLQLLSQQLLLLFPAQDQRQKELSFMIRRIKPEKPLKKKDQIALDEELALRLHAEEQAELERIQKERVAQEEARRAAIIEEIDSIQAMIKANEQLAARLQAKEQEQFSIEEKSRMLVEMIAERKKFFASQRVAEQRSKPPIKSQTRNRMCTYLKNMEVVKSNETRTEGSSKRAGDELESDKSKKQKINEHIEVEKDDDQ
ncbi:hypothetical protein Tco_0993960 [Tanacetum coccineum]